MTMVGLQRGWSALRGWLLGLIAALCIVAVLAAPARAEASVYTVNSTADAADANLVDGRCADANGDCTLRAAIQEANVHPNDPTGPDEITIPSGTYTLTIAGANEDDSATGDLDITDNVNITGAGKDSTEVNGNKADRVFHNRSKTVEISGLTVKDGRAGSGGAFYNAGIPETTKVTFDNVRFTTNEATSDGGAIFNEGTVTGIDSEFTNNRALGSFGGAITQYSGTAKLDFTRTNFEGNTAPSNGGAINMNGTLKLDAANFTGNTSTFGSGGGVLIYSGHATIDNSTFAGNRATSAGGGGLYLNEVTGAQSTVTNSTFSGNEASYGGGIHNGGGAWVLTNVTVANNTGGGILSNGSLSSKNSIFAHNNVLNCWGNFISQGHNLSSDATCTGGGTDDRTGVDPKLGELAYNGGPTKTLALQDGSPAIDAADNTNAPTVDQRGVSRPQDGDGDGQAVHDIGAFEKVVNKPPELVLPDGVTEEATSKEGAEVTYTATATDREDGPLTPNCSPSSGSTFALGTTTVNCSVEDSDGLTESGSFTVTVQDTTAPELTLPDGGITAEATGPDGATVNFDDDVSATDLVDGNVDVTCDPASGSTFSLGPTTVDCSAQDAAGNPATGSFTVKVQDTTAPELTVPSNTIVVEATDASGTTVNFADDVSASDAVDPNPSIECTPASGSTFGLGTTPVSCTAKDASGNESPLKTFEVSVTYDPVSPCNIGEIESPVNNVSSADDPGMSAYKFGSRGVIPAKFRAVCNGDPIDTQAEADAHPMKLMLTQLGTTPEQDAVVENTVTGSANTGDLFRFDDAAGHYIYNIGVKGLAKGTYKLTISEANGGTTHDEWFSIK